MHNNISVRLKNHSIQKLTDGAALDTLVLEEEMKQYNGGITLSKMGPCSYMGEDIIASVLPHFSPRADFSDEEISKIVDKHPNITEPCSMALSSLKELSEHMLVGYQAAHFHYILGKTHNLKRSFPYWCCGVSSVNVMLSLIELGYPNAAYAFAKGYDHGYVILPFTIKKHIQGTVIIDPTYDQLGDKNTRNAVIIKLGSTWEYKTKWKGGSNLFPNRIWSIDILKETPYPFNYDFHHQNGEQYLERAFSNPVKIPKNQ